MIRPTDQLGRRIAVELLREIRRDMPFGSTHLKGDWTRREWNRSCRGTAYGCAQSIERFRKANTMS